MKKLIIILLTFFLLNFSIYAIPDSGILRYNFSSTEDLWGVNDGINFGANSVGDYPLYQLFGDSSPNSFEFDDTVPDYIRLPDNLLDSENIGTVNLWYKFTDVTSVDEVFSATSNASSNPALFLRKDNDHIEYVFRDDSGSNLAVISGTSALIEDMWYMFTWVSTGTTIKMFINGVEESLSVGSGTNTGDWFGDLGTTYIHTYNIGAQFQGSTTPQVPVDGVIDEVRVYDVDLNDTEISNLFQYGNILGGIVPPVEKEFLRFNFSSTEDLFNDNDGINFGANSVSEFPVYNTTGNSSPNSFNFVQADGDYISLEDNLLQTASNGTINLWAKFDSIASIDELFSVSSNLSTKPLLTARKNNDKIEYVFRDDSNNNQAILRGDTVLTTGVWYMLTWWSNGTEIKLYVDGIEESLSVISGTNTGDWFNDLGNIYIHKYTIGASFQNSPTPIEPFDGVMDEFHIFGVALDETEIINLFNVGSTVITNIPPIMNSSYILPQPVYDDEDIFGFCKANDVNGDNLNYSYQWIIDFNATDIEQVGIFTQGIPVNVDTITDNETTVGESYILSCMATDGLNESDWLNSSQLIVSAIPLTLNYLSPLNETRSNIQPEIIFNASHTTNSTVSCDLFVDGVLNQTNSSVTTNINSSFNLNLTIGLYTFNINCTDGVRWVDSSLFEFEFDDREPIINSILPLTDNTTFYNNFTMNITGNVTDDKVWKVNRTIFYPNGTVFYNNYSGELPNVTTYSWSDIFNTTLMPNGFYEMNIQGTDPHTKKHFKPAKNVIKSNNDIKLRYELDFDNVEIQLVAGNVFGFFENIDTVKLDDRYPFVLNFSMELPPNRRMVFEVRAENGIEYLEWSDYNSHFIIADEYWLDFGGVEGTQIVTKINDTTYKVEIWTGKRQKDFKFESLGGLNDNEINITFQLNNCEPDWICTGYESCNTSDLARCDTVFDNNACGLEFGLFGESLDDFTPLSCNFCELDEVFLSQTGCVAGNRTRFFEDLNFTTCCDVTGIPSDCVGNVTQTEAIVGINESCSIFYDSADVSPALINTLTKALIFLGSAIFIVITGVLIGIGIRRFKGRKEVK